MTSTTSHRCRTCSTKAIGVAGSSTAPAFLPSSRTREDAVQVDRGGRLRLDEEMIGAGAREVVEVALGLDHHQVDVERLGGRAPHRLDHRRAERCSGRSGRPSRRRIQSAPAASTKRISSAKRPRSAARIEGATTTGRPARPSAAIVKVSRRRARSARRPWRTRPRRWSRRPPRRRPPHGGRRVAHGDAEAAPREHGDVVRGVADGGDLADRDAEPLRQLDHRRPLVRERVGHVEVVALERATDAATPNSRRISASQRSSRPKSSLTPTSLPTPSRNGPKPSTTVGPNWTVRSSWAT